jgi:ArsR family transcriptional regulator
MSSSSPKRALFEQFAIVAKAVAHPLRLEILEQLAQGERSVEVVADRTRVSIANVSQHLQQMRRAGLIVGRRDGKFVYYRLTDNSVLDLLASLRRLAETQSSEVERILRGYFHDRDGLEEVSRTELMERIRAGVVTVLDVRPEDEFALGHLPGAINVPLGELEKRLLDLDPRREIVAYCRGPYCVLSYEAAALLRARGFQVRRMEDGLPEWRAAGLPVEAASQQ